MKRFRHSGKAAKDRMLRKVDQMGTRHVEVVPYNDAWKRDFAEIKSVIGAALGELALSIEHVGSTAVEGLSAKPVIDIDVVIRDISLLDEVICALGGTGYVYEGDLGIEGREAFAYEGNELQQEHHLYVCPRDSAELRRHILFRDYLRSHPGAVMEYSRIKEEGAALYPYDIDGYIEHKAQFIKRIYEELGVS